MEADARDELLERAGFGKQVEAFWGSRIGEYLQGRAQELYTEGIQDLKKVDPTDWKMVQSVQNRIWLAERFEKWLSEVVLDGIKSLEILEGDDDAGT